jgi:hypothetical protein
MLDYFNIKQKDYYGMFNNYNGWNGCSSCRSFCDWFTA